MSREFIVIETEREREKKEGAQKVSRVRRNKQPVAFLNKRIPDCS